MRLMDEQIDHNSAEAPVLVGLGVESPKALCFHEGKVAPSSPHCWFLTFCVFPCITAQSVLAQMFVWMDTTLWEHNHGLLYCTMFACCTSSWIGTEGRVQEMGMSTWRRRWASFDNWGLPNTNPQIRLMLFKPVFVTSLCWVVYHKKFPFRLKCTSIWVFPTISLVVV